MEIGDNFCVFTLGDGAYADSPLFTLRSCTGGDELIISLEIRTLVGAGDGIGSGIGCIRPNCFESSSNAFIVGSPAASDGTIVEGGCVKIVIISIADLWERNYAWHERDRITHPCSACPWEITCHISIMFHSWPYIPTLLSI